MVLKYSSDDGLGSGGPALALKSSGDFDLATMAQADVTGKLGGRLPIVSHVRPTLIVVAPPRLDQPLYLGQGGEPVDVQALVPERSIKGVHVHAICRGTGPREIHFDLFRYVQEPKI